MARPGPSLAGRAAVVLTLFVGFYVLAIVLAVALLAAPIVVWLVADRVYPYLIIGGLVAGLGILRSLLPGRERWTDPGPRFDGRTQPELTALVQQVATSVGQQVPSELYLLDEVNAFVTSRGGFLGFGGRRVLAVGVPLMMVLDTAELASVLAHEFGHFHGGDTRLTPLVYRTRVAIGRTLEASSGWIQGIFKAYAGFYLAQSQGISRAQEFAADQLAARVTSPQIAANALARVTPAASLYAFYLQNEYAPVLRTGRRPPYLAGFHALLHSPGGTKSHGATADVALGDHTASRFDSHPGTAERIMALGIDPRSAVSRGWPSTPSTSLLRDPVRLEETLIGWQLKADPNSVQPVSWEEAGQEVYLPRWRAQIAEQLIPVAPGLTAGRVPIAADELAALGGAILQHADRTGVRTEREAIARRLCEQFLGVAAADAGWTMHALPGEPIQFSRDGVAIDILDAYGRACDGALSPDAWYSGLRGNGLEDAAPRPRAVPPVASRPAPPPGPAPAPVVEDDEVREPAMAAATPRAAAVAPAPPAPPGPASAPAGMQYRATPPSGLGRKRELVIDGTRAQWGEQVIDARAVTAVGYKAWNGVLEARFASPQGELHFKLGSNNSRVSQGAAEAWQALVDWSERYVTPPLVDRLLEQLQATGRVDLGGLTFTWDGILTRKGPLPWDQLAGTTFTGTDVALHRRADNLDGHTKAAEVRTDVERGGALIPGLCEAILATRERARGRRRS